MKKYNLLIFMAIALSSGLFAQVNYSANDQITPYNGKYRAGVNPGYYGGNWDNFDLTDLSAGNAAIDEDGVGVRAIRGTLPEHFGIVWDYNNWIPVYEYYDALGIKDNTLVVGVAHPDHRDPIDYCPNDPEESTMFANLYEPIWDGGANGTPVNDNNYMAKYVYDLVTTVGDHVKFWEVWNEPGYDLSGYKSSLQPGQPGNWYENDPNPCDIIIRAPIQNYIRTLRITYEVVKTLSPDDYIVLSGIGTDAFLDALMRNTDNPNGGTVTAEFPLTSGAYFDVVGFHAYPHFDGSTQHWDNNLQQMVFTRHSDGAVDGFDGRVNQRKALLGTYGYDGNTYPEKLLIVTEMGVPRLPYGNYFGTDDLQVNYIMKSVAHATKIGITQTHVWQLAERTTVANASGSFDVMGFYQNINDLNPGDETFLPQGVAHHTASLLLKDGVYSQSETNMLNAPAGVRANAFLMPNGSYVYMLWAETTQDMSEFASASYSFPASYGQSMDAKQWNYSATNAVATMSSQNISLSATPIFFTMPRSNGTLTLNCPMGNIIEVPTTEAEGGAVVNWVAPTATSTCGIGSVNIENTGGNSGDFFPFGNTVINYTATDGCGNVQRCATRVAVASTGGINTSCHINLWDFKFAGQRDGHKYFISKYKTTYQEAEAIAASYGMKLLSIETQAENEFLRYQFTDIGFIGLSDAQSEGNLTWASGEPVSFTSFDDCVWCEPNTGANDYAEFHPWNAKWSFNDGTVPQFFMMEMDCNSPAPSSISITNFPLNIQLLAATGTVVNWATPTATTSCPDGIVNITQTAGPTSGSYFPSNGQVVTITYTFTDNCGNSTAQSFTVMVEEDANVACPPSIPGFTVLGEYNGHKYFVSNGIDNWNNNKNLAEVNNGYLAVINDASENEFIKNSISEMVHIGLNDIQSEGNLSWTNGTPVSYTNLSDCDWCGLNTEQNDFGLMLPWDGKWSFDHPWAARKMILEMDCDNSTGGDLTITSCSNDLNFNTNGASEMVVNWNLPTATTTCASGVVNINQVLGPAPGDLVTATGQQVTVAYTITDDCGNNQECSFTITVTNDGATSCAPSIAGFTKLGEYNGRGYYMSNASASWEDAKVLSENAGGYLASMGDQAENDFLKSNLNGNMAFIGYNDAATEGVGQWANNESVGFDLSYGNSGENDFAVMNFWAGTWQMVSQWVHKPFVVEMDCGGSQGGDECSFTTPFSVSDANLSNIFAEGIQEGSNYSVELSAFNNATVEANTVVFEFDKSNGQQISENVIAPTSVYDVSKSGSFDLVFSEENASGTLWTQTHSFTAFPSDYVGTGSPFVVSDYKVLDDGILACGFYTANSPTEGFSWFYFTMKVDLSGNLIFQTTISNSRDNVSLRIRGKAKLGGYFLEESGAGIGYRLYKINASGIEEWVTVGVSDTPSEYRWFIDETPDGQSFYMGHNNKNAYRADVLRVDVQNGNVSSFQLGSDLSSPEYWSSWYMGGVPSNDGGLVVFYSFNPDRFNSNSDIEYRIDYFDENFNRIWTREMPDDVVDEMTATNFLYSFKSLPVASGYLYMWKVGYSDYMLKRMTTDGYFVPNCDGGDLPDLTVSNITNLPSFGLPNSQVNFNFDLNNLGDVDVVGSYDIEMYLSADASFSNDDVLVGAVPTGGTPVGTIASVPASIGIPGTMHSGNYYLIIVADVDNGIAESDEGNNELSTLFPIGGSGGGCGTIPGYQKLGDYNGHSYYLSDMSVPWSQAKSLSENESGYLATMNTQAENDFLKSSIGNSMVFIGYHDSNTEGVGQWANNEQVTLDLSYGNSPENDYAVMNFWAGTWQLVSGGVYKHFVMEKECSAAQPQPAIAPQYTRIQHAEIYPNPTDDMVYVRWVSSQEQDVELAIYDMIGNLIFSQLTSAPKGFYETEMNVSKFDAGVYFVRILGSDGQNVLRFVKE